MGRNIIIDVEKRLPILMGTVTSPNLNISGDVSNAFQFWQGKTETSSGASSEIGKYWSNLNRSEAVSIPWSAAFISYLLRNQNFPGSGLHAAYVEAAEKGTNNWHAFAIPKNAKRIKVSVGDVLVKPRSGDYTWSHGDVVYAIEGNKAHLVGGNIGNTVKSNTIDLNPDGTIKSGVGSSDGQRYLVILKKNPSSVPMLYLRRILLWGVLPTVALVGGYFGYQYWKHGTMPKLLK